MQERPKNSELAKVVEAIWLQQLESFDNDSLIPAEELLRKHPELLAKSEFAIDVIFNEYELRCRNNDGPDQGEFLKRFPEFAEDLERQFRVLEAFTAAEMSAASGTLESTGKLRRTSPDRELEQNFNQRFLDRKVIGKGATATVEIAFDTRLQQEVALKRLHTHLKHSTRAIQRLYREAQTVARLHHPNIVPFHEILDDGQQLVLVTRYIRGTNLREVHDTEAARGIDQIVGWMRQIAEALDYAHQNEVTHRDVKPSNILIDEKGNALLSDFGLASFAASSGGITQTGELIGTPAFMSPEQARGTSNGLSAASDIYSLGATMYCLLSGSPPFEGSFPSVIQQVISQDPNPLKSQRFDVPRDLVTIVEKCLHKMPERRYASARALAEDLRRFQDGEIIRARKSGSVERLANRARKRPWLSAAIATTVLMATFLSGTIFQLRKVRDQRNQIQNAERTNRKLLAAASVDAGRLLMQRGQMESATEQFRNGLEQGCENRAAVHLHFVEALLALGKSEAAAEHLRLAATEDTASVRPLLQYWKSELAALGYSEFGEAPLRTSEFEQLDPAKQRFLQGLRADQSEEALGHFESAISADSSHHGARRMALIMALSLAKFEKVIEDVKVALQVFPGDVDFQLIRGLALAATGRIEEAKLQVEGCDLKSAVESDWLSFCEFVYQITHKDLRSVTGEHIKLVAAHLRNFNRNFLPLIESRHWRFPQRIADQFQQLASEDQLLKEEDWLELARGLVDVHPEATLLVIAGEHELMSDNPREQLVNSRDYFLRAVEAPTFIRVSHDSAWAGVYATSMALYMVHKHNPETNAAHMIMAARHIDPSDTDSNIWLRSFYIPLITAGEWDLARGYIDRAVEIADDDHFKSEAYWHQALWYKNREEFGEVIRICRQFRESVPPDFKPSQNWDALQRSCERQLRELLDDA